MRSRLLVPTLLLAAGAWLAAGPGGVTLRAIAACRHHVAAHEEHAGHHHQTLPLPLGAPCFCDGMTGGGDVLLAPAIPAGAVVQLVVIPVSLVRYAVPGIPLLAASAAPLTPPPNPAA